MPNNFRLIIIIVVATLSGLLLFSQLAFRQNEEGSNNTPAPPFTMQWAVPSIPAEFSFAGERVPLERTEIRELFDREWLYIYYQQSNNLYILKLVQRYFPLIEERLKQNGIPDDFKYACVAESNLQNLISKAGAVGFWQFMRGSAPHYNLIVNNEVDERYHVLESTDAACLYLKQAYSRFGSWTAAAAAYNCGQGGYASFAAAQQTKYYYDLHLPEETNRYLFRVLSFKYLIENTKALGYNLPDTSAYQPYNTRIVQISRSISNLPRYAIDQGTSYKMLRILNPWLRGYSLTVRPGKVYQLLLPAQ